MRNLIAIGIAAGIALSLPAVASESALARIKQSGTIKLGYRENSIPFSFVADDKQPRGYSVDLCRIVADDLAAQLKLPKLDVRWVAVPSNTSSRQGVSARASPVRTPRVRKFTSPNIEPACSSASG